MSWSLVEIRSLAIKATRGAGLSWGLAEEAGFAVRWLHRRGVSGTHALAHYLEQCAERGVDPAKCPIQIGAAISDGGYPDGSKLGKIRTPILLIPFIAQSLSEGCCKLNCEDISFVVSKEAFNTSVPATGYVFDSATCDLEHTDEMPEALTQCTRVGIEDANYIKTLGKFAHNTYAPATEESRLAGAGAGLNDND